MADQDNEVVEQPSYLGMSDEEIMNAPRPEAVSVETTAEEKEPEGEAETSEEIPAEVPDTEESDADDEEGDKPDEKEVDEDEDKAPEKKETKEPEDKPEEKAPEESAIDYKAEYERLIAPFKANGRDISVKNVDDAISLMQMGANYNKRMAALKPNLKIMRMLENNNLLDEAKLSYLIDLDKKNPAAINKLVKDSGMDPMDLDAEKAGAYKQSTYTVDDREMELDTVLDDLQSTPTYNRTLDIVSTKWDGASKQVIAGQPQLLKVINDHVASGIYDIITEEIESERVFGRLNGLSDIEAYRQVGDAIQARGGFNHLGSSQRETPTQKVIVPPKPSKVDDDKLKEKRRAASSTKPAVPSTTNKDFNPLSMSDDEFSKFANKFP